MFLRKKYPFTKIFEAKSHVRSTESHSKSPPGTEKLFEIYESRKITLQMASTREKIP